MCAEDAREQRNHLLFQVLAFARSTSRERVAIRTRGREVSHADLARATARGAREISERVSPGGRLLIASRDQLVAAVGFLSALRSHATPILVDGSSPRWIARVAGRWAAEAALGLEAEKADLACPQIGGTTVESWLESAHAEETGWEDVPPVAPRDPAFWTFTSGTTGEPRAVVHSHRGPVAAFESFGRWIGLEPGDRTVSTAGVPFVYALGNNLLFPLLAGATAILPRDLRLPEVLDHLATQQATVFVAGPGSLDAIARLGDRPRWREALLRLRLVLSAGESLPAALFARWRDTFGQSPIDNLGCSEMFNSFVAAAPRDPRPGLLGHVVPGYEIRVGDEAPRPGLRGPLRVRGESRAVALSRGPEGRLHACSREEFCETGDEIEIEADGGIRYLGRSDDRFKVRGEFVQPLEVERQIGGVPGIREVCVGPEASTGGLSQIRVDVVIDADADSAEVLAAVRERLRVVLGTLARASRVEAISALPRTDRGKLVRTRVPAPPE